MPNLQFWFSGAALGSFLALIATTSSLGYAWYRAALSEQSAAASGAEAKQEQARLQAIREQLQVFYVSGGLLVDRNLPKDISNEDFVKYVQEVETWINSTAGWIESHLGKAAASRFMDKGTGFTVSWNRAVNEHHNNIINVVGKFRENLAKLIENGNWGSKANVATELPHS
jgi:hypothetical protein